MQYPRHMLHFREAAILLCMHITQRKRSQGKNRIRDTIPGCQKCRNNSIEARISKCVTNMVRHYDQYEREEDGAMHVDITLPVLKERFQILRSKEFTNEDSLNCLYLGSFKTRFEICKDEDGGLKFSHGHWGGIFVSPRLMNYEMVPHTWKEFIYHVCRARDQYSIAAAGLVAGGKERKEGRQTIFFTPLDLFNSDANGAELITDFNKARRLHYQVHWRPEQDAVYWVHLRSAQNAGLEFWQTGSNSIITYQSAPK